MGVELEDWEPSVSARNLRPVSDWAWGVERYDRVISGLVDREVEKLGLGRSMGEVLRMTTAGGCRRGEMGVGRRLRASWYTIRAN